VGLEENPARRRLHYAVTGLYHYDHRIIEIVARLEHSALEELEITDAAYLALGALHVEKLGARHRVGRHRGEPRQADRRRQPQGLGALADSPLCPHGDICDGKLPRDVPRATR
jgi:hypothetical protein